MVKVSMCFDMKTKKIVAVFVGTVLIGMVLHGTWNPMRVSLLYKHVAMFITYVATVMILTERKHGEG